MSGPGVHHRWRRTAGTALRAVPLLVGWIVLALAVDVGLGAALDAVRPSGEPAPAAPDTATGGAGQGATIETQMPRRCAGSVSIAPEHVRFIEEASAAERTWIEEYWCEFNRLGGEYLPYLFSRTTDTEQELINIREGVRRSYQPRAAGGSAPVIWFFGGSTMFGWGQRDEHTIPSEVARLGEAAGTPVRVVNFGNLAWVHWQEVLAFEQELAHRPAPDLVVFYDGVNDANVQGSHGTQSARPSDDPTIYDFGDDPPAPVVPILGSEPEADEPSLADRWVDTSAVARLLQGAAGVLGLAPAPAAADDTPSPDTVVRRTLEVYERGRSVALDLAERHGVDPHFFWQPRIDNVPDEVYALAEQNRVTPLEREIERALVAGLTPPTIDLTGAVDGMDPDEIFTDGAHTNERGAAIVAAALWEHLRPAVDDWYTTGRGDR